MFFDEIVIGSGLAALGVVLGLPANARVLVIGGPPTGQFVYYGRTQTDLCAYLGHGGLGAYWHGTIPTDDEQYFTGASAAYFERLFHYFYPHTRIAERLGKPWRFVPKRPIRPKVEWLRLNAKRSDRLVILNEIVSRFAPGDRHVSVHTARSTYYGKRLWVCAGALHSPGLLDRSFDTQLSRQFMSDHVFCYLGQIDRSRTNVTPPRVQRTREGAWFENRYDDKGKILYILRPARFGYTRLDYGIEQRSTYGCPAGNTASRIARGASLGLFAEALYNHYGLFPNARLQSVYAQIEVPDAHEFCSGSVQLSIRRDVIQKITDVVRTSPPWTEMQSSRRTDLFIPSAHLHHSIDEAALKRVGVNGPTSRVQVVDASILRDIGPSPHSFKMMVAALQKAQTLTQSERGPLGTFGAASLRKLLSSFLP